MKKFLFFLFLVLLIFPEVQLNLNLIKSKPLVGVYENAAPPVINDSTWLHGICQAQWTKHFDDSLGLKSDLVRLYNQIDFSLFGLVHASKVVRGKEDYLYPLDYLHSVAGKGFAGKVFLDAQVRDLKKVQDILWNQHRIFLLVILCPDKPTFYPEYIPDRFLSKPTEFTNGKYLAKRCVEEGVHVIDFNPYFLSMKKNSKFPLIPKTGVHWSFYGAWLAADSMARYLRANTGYPVPRLVLDSISKPALPIGEDNDMGSTLNLIHDIPSPQTGYPRFHGVPEDSKPKPNALFIGDSFYWNWLNSGIISTLFSNRDFWYYCKDVYPQSNQKPTSLADIDYDSVIKKQNFIILVQVNGGYGKIGYGFPETAMGALDPVNSKLIKTEQLILRSPEWLEAVKKQAAQTHIKFEDMLRMDALWYIDQENKKHQPKK